MSKVTDYELRLKYDLSKERKLKSSKVELGVEIEKIFDHKNPMDLFVFLDVLKNTIEKQVNEYVNNLKRQYDVKDVQYKIKKNLVTEYSHYSDNIIDSENGYNFEIIIEFTYLEDDKALLSRLRKREAKKQQSAS